MPQVHQPDLILTPSMVSPPTRALLAQTAVVVVVNLVGDVLADHLAERKHQRSLTTWRARQELRSADLDRLERLSSTPGLAPAQKASAAELMLELIAERHGHRAHPQHEEA